MMGVRLIRGRAREQIYPREGWSAQIKSDGRRCNAAP
jgi:hypothetical protein